MKAQEILSGENRTFRMFQTLYRGVGIRKHGLALLSGPKQVEEILRDFPDRCEGLILRRDQDVFDAILPDNTRRYRLSGELFRNLDIYGTNQPILLVRAGQFPSWDAEKWPEGCTLFVPFQDPVNVGSVIRSAAAFGVSRIVLLKEAAHPFHHKSTRVAGSTLFRIPIFEGPPIRGLRRAGAPLIAMSPKGEDAGKFQFPSTFGLLPGLEGPGIPAGVKSEVTLSIPMEPGVESLNSSLAVGIMLYLWRRGMGETGKMPLTGVPPEDNKNNPADSRNPPAGQIRERSRNHAFSNKEASDHQKTKRRPQQGKPESRRQENPEKP